MGCGEGGEYEVILRQISSWGWKRVWTGAELWFAGAWGVTSTNKRAKQHSWAAGLLPLPGTARDEAVEAVE